MGDTPETAQNDHIEFVQDFEPINDADILADAPADPVQDHEGDAVTNDILPDAGTSSRGRQRKMSRAMAESVSQQDFYGNRNMYYMMAQNVFNGQMEADLFNDLHMELQECTRNPISFHAEMMGDIMYFHQAIKQPDTQEFVKTIMKEVEAHIKNND